MASNDCITDTTRYSVWRAGLLFCIGFESNGNRFESSPRCQQLWKINPTILSSNFRKDTQDLLHLQVSLLIQMRTGHVPLQQYLHRIGKVEPLHCPNCHEDETVHHYLTNCKSFETQRRRMEGHLQRVAKSVSTLLTNPKAFPHLFKYINDTGCFHPAAVYT